MALEDGHVQVIEALLAAHANVNIVRIFDSPFFQDFVLHSLHTTHTHTRVHAHEQTSVSGQTPLHHAAERNRTDGVRLLIDGGASLDMVSRLLSLARSRDC